MKGTPLSAGPRHRGNKPVCVRPRTGRQPCLSARYKHLRARKLAACGHDGCQCAAKEVTFRSVLYGHERSGAKSVPEVPTHGADKP